jgi:hypothetical protein
MMQGLQQGLTLNGIMQQRQAQAEAQKQAEYQRQRLREVMSNPNAGAADYSRLMGEFPSLSKELKSSFDVFETGQKQAISRAVTPAYAALQSGQPDIAIQQLEKHRVSADNSGNRQLSDSIGTAIESIKRDPTQARAALYFLGSGADDKFAENVSKWGVESRAQQKFPAELRQSEALATKTEAESNTAQVTAKFAESKAVQELAKTGWDIKAIANDIDYKRQSIEIERAKTAIARMAAGTSAEGNSLKRQELGLKVQEMIDKRDEKIREKANNAKSGAASIDNMLNTISRLESNPRLNAVLGPLEGRAPAVLSDQSADAIALIETIGSQAFMAQIPAMKGLGALSEKEGDKLQTSLQNLSRVQSESQFRSNLKEASRLMLKARATLAESTGVPLSSPDTPASAPSAEAVDALLKKYGGK